MLGSRSPSAMVCPSGPRELDSSSTSFTRAAASRSSVIRPTRRRAISTTRSSFPAPVALRCSPRPRADSNSARGSRGRGWNPTPAPVTSGSKQPCVTRVTSCPARARPCPSPVKGATSPREPAVMIATRTGVSMARSPPAGEVLAKGGRTGASLTVAIRPVGAAHCRWGANRRVGGSGIVSAGRCASPAGPVAAGRFPVLGFVRAGRVPMAAAPQTDSACAPRRSGARARLPWTRQRRSGVRRSRTSGTVVAARVRPR